jgi:hypothetical protein
MSEEAAKYQRPEPIATPDDYALIFEVNRTGQKVLDDLIKRFANKQRKGNEGINRILDTFEYQGQRNVLDFIVNQINKANGVNDDSEINVELDE